MPPLSVGRLTPLAQGGIWLWGSILPWLPRAAHETWAACACPQIPQAPAQPGEGPACPEGAGALVGQEGNGVLGQTGRHLQRCHCIVQRCPAQATSNAEPRAGRSQGGIIVTKSTLETCFLTGLAFLLAAHITFLWYFWRGPQQTERKCKPFLGPHSLQTAGPSGQGREGQRHGGWDLAPRQGRV